MSGWTFGWLAYLVVVLVLSGVSFLAYGVDKWRARREERRIPENTLHLLAVLGGWPGALAGQRFFRHKTQKRVFRLVFWLCVAAHVMIVATLIAITRQWGWSSAAAS